MSVITYRREFSFVVNQQVTWPIIVRADTLVDAYLEKGLLTSAKFDVYCHNESSAKGTFILAPMPGYCGVVISMASYLNPMARGYYGKAFHFAKEQVARELGYGLMLATVELRNIPEVVGASNAGWHIEPSFRNPHTSHDLGLMVKKLVI